MNGGRSPAIQYGGMNLQGFAMAEGLRNVDCAKSHPRAFRISQLLIGGGRETVSFGDALGHRIALLTRVMSVDRSGDKGSGSGDGHNNLQDQFPYWKSLSAAGVLIVGIAGVSLSAFNAERLRFAYTLSLVLISLVLFDGGALLQGAKL
jgi:hypothetical protein